MLTALKFTLKMDI